MQEVNIWGEIGKTIEGLFSGLLMATQHAVTHGLPRVLLAGLTLVVGWLIAVFVRKLLAKGLRGFGFDVVMERTGLRAILRQRGVDAAPSALVGWGVYVIIVYSALVMAFDRVGFDMGLALLDMIARWVPRALMALLLLAIGHWIGRWLGHIMTHAAQVALVPFPQLMGAIVHVAVLLFAAMLAIRYLDLASDMLLLMGLATVLGTLLLLALLLAVCAKDLLVSALSSRILKSIYEPGDRVRLEPWEGEIVAIKMHVVQLRTDAGIVDVPSSRFIREPVLRMDS